MIITDDKKKSEWKYSFKMCKVIKFDVRRKKNPLKR